jgi:hypothetical protein
LRGEVYEPTRSELDSARQHFAYELDMLRAVTDMLRDRPDPMALHNALLESALVHARNLHDFFIHQQSDGDDVLALHYVADQSLRTRPALTYVRSCQQPINKALSHLTYHRTVKKPLWRLSVMRNEIETAYSQFLEALPEDERENWPATQEPSQPDSGFDVS